MNVAILSTLCFLTVVGGVYSSFLGRQDQTRVDVTIFAPRQFLGNTTRIYFNYHLDTEVVDTVTSSKVMVFDVEEPLINARTRKDACANMSCDHACDEATGLCACFKGYKAEGQFKCIDVNECMEGKVRCDKAAGCHNRKGTYDCICGEDYYGNGKTCRVCSPECGPGEFEFRQCSTHHDRECMNATLLQQPITSDNLIVEDRGHVKNSATRLDKLPERYVGFSNYKLRRGTGVYLDLTVRFIDAAQQFVSANETRPLTSDLDRVAPPFLRSPPVRKLCPNPLPDYYHLQYQKQEVG
ncbi:pro-epidermal growth factor [Plakobranchus ocellatus]|uniref:Pro-epidermal growth factor n=1 Tax=Plakobranchus ocellatus TaxID=259542 RepID=A0AAV3XY77_9GAST|nr:pro-epidermal growth factor [Plakobranchus ocellatus]